MREPADDQSRGEIIKKLNKMFADLEEEYDSREQFIQTTADQGQEDTEQHIVSHPAGNQSNVNFEEKQSSASDREIKVTEMESINKDEIRVNENISENHAVITINVVFFTLQHDSHCPITIAHATFCILINGIIALLACFELTGGAIVATVALTAHGDVGIPQLI